MKDYITDFNVTCNKINKNISIYNSNLNKIKSNNFENFTNSIGVISLIIAFAIRFAITTNNINITKT